MYCGNENTDMPLKSTDMILKLNIASISNISGFTVEFKMEKWLSKNIGQDLILGYRKTKLFCRNRKQT